MYKRSLKPLPGQFGVMMRAIAYTSAVALLLGIAAGPAAAQSGTVVISGASVCRDDPSNSWCQGKSTPSGRRLSLAVENQASQQVNELSRTAPWMRGDVPWCEAFPGSAHCVNRLIARR